MSSPESSLLQCIEEISQKAQASLMSVIDDHVNSAEFQPSQGLDFLDTKNEMMITYLIELTVRLRNELEGKQEDLQNKHRLMVVKTALDKMKSLDKKLRYQIDKLLAGASTATEFASGSEDPLNYRPGLSSMLNDEAKNEDDESSDGSDTDGADVEKAGSDLDDDLATARATLVLARDKQKDQADEQSDVYRAPRLTAVPYTQDNVDKESEREKKDLRRMRASELAHAMRAQYGDAPDLEDIHGGAELGKQKEASRRMAERQAEKTRFEEDMMIRLTTTRKEKQERKRHMREEGSNLGAIAELGNIVRDTNYAGGRNPNKVDDRTQGMQQERHANGRRKRDKINKDGRPVGNKGSKSVQVKNSFQAELFGGERGSSKKKKRR